MQGKQKKKNKQVNQKKFGRVSNKRQKSVCENTQNSENFKLEKKNQYIDFFEESPFFQNDVNFMDFSVEQLQSKGKFIQKNCFSQQNLIQYPSKKVSQKTKKSRKSQNACKKYHTIAQKVLKYLGLTFILKIISKINYRLEYFVLILMVVEKSGKLDLFSPIYTKQIQDKIKNYRNKNTSENEKLIIENEISGFKNSLNSMNTFMKGDIEGSIGELFDHQKIRNKEYESEATERMKELNNQLEISQQLKLNKLRSFVKMRKRKNH